MSSEGDDLTPAQEGRVPETDTLARRAARSDSGRGRLLRPRSLLTLAFALVAGLIAALLWLKS